VSSPGAAGSGSTGAPTPIGTPALVPGAVLHGPLGCPALIGVLVLQRLAVQLEHPYTVVVGRCDSGAGSPPSGVFVVSGGGPGARVVQTLVPSAKELQVSALTTTSDGIEITAAGYSRSDVPRCCPDRTVILSWRRAGDAFVAVP
jgi:hypothetical protein